MYIRMAPPLWIVTVVLPGFNVPAVHGPCAIGIVASTVLPPVSADAPPSSVPPVPDEAPLVPTDPPVAGTPVSAALPVAPVAPATPPALPPVAVPLMSGPAELVPLWPAMLPLLVLAILVVPDDSCVAVAALHPEASNAGNGNSALA
jgi:hypothetical protein